jgi:hypothetical protein
MSFVCLSHDHFGEDLLLPRIVGMSVSQSFVEMQAQVEECFSDYEEKQYEEIASERERYDAAN